MEKQKLMDLFDEVLINWKNAQSYVLQETMIYEDDYSHEDLEKEILDLRREFQEALKD